MQELIELFGNRNFIAHGYCLSWGSKLIWLHVVSDCLIVFAYFSIPLTLVHFLRKDREVPFPWLIAMFGLFIFACGTTHLISIINIWVPLYWLDGWVKALTAAASVVTACAMYWVVPRALLMRSAAAIFETHEAAMVTDADANILRVNSAFETITGFRSQEAVGRNPSFMSSGKHSSDFFSEMWRQLLAIGTWTGEIWGKRKNGDVYPQHMTITAVRNDKGNVNQYVAIFEDITERKKTEDEIHNLAFFDALTGLPNRRLFLDRLNRVLSISARNRKFGVLLYLDLDKFKLLNDSQGHDYGDMLLIEVAKRLKAGVRAQDTVARLGGDEFVILIEDIDVHADEASRKAAHIAENLRTSLSRPYQLKEHLAHTSASIGACLFFGNDEPGEELLKRADIAMYQAKAAGRDTVRFFDPQMQQAVEVRAALESDLRQALTEDQFQLYYQCQVDKDRKIIGAEALIRWIHPRRGMVFPGEFIPVAEDSSLILDIGYWVIDSACQQLNAWSHDSATRHLVLAINISATQFMHPKFVGHITAAIDKHQIDPGRLKLELTESVVMKDLDVVVKKMQELTRELGIGLSLDDFGTGYSSLSYLKQLPFAQIKIDRQFVINMTSDVNDATMVKTIIDLAQNFGLQVIAEGVETEQQLAFLHAQGCGEFQGFLFSKPIPAADFLGLCSAESTE